jgi:hypothetical protein
MATAVVFMLTAACVGMLTPLNAARAATVSAVEFVSFQYFDYFLVTSPNETALLDSGATPGVHRGLLEFKVNDAPGPGLVPVCRFSYANKTRFLTAFPEECAALKANAAWKFEGEAFYARLPNGGGICEEGTMPIYRAYTRIVGAPAHRLTPYFGEACTTVDCVREGVGNRGVAFCAPESGDVARQRTQQMSGGAWEFSFTAADGVQKVVRLSFGDAFANFPVTGRGTLWPDLPYHAHASDGIAVAGWDATAGKMVVALDLAIPYSGTMLQFDFDGVTATSGCAFDGFEISFGESRGACHPLTARRL